MPSVIQDHRSESVALGAGVSLVVLTLVVHYLLLTPLGYSPGTFSVYMWSLLGAFILGSIPTYFLLQYRLFSPFVISFGLYLTTAVHSYLTLVGTEIRFTATTGLGGIVPLSHPIYLQAWMGALALLLLCGAVEYSIHRLLDLRRGTRGSGI